MIKIAGSIRRSFCFPAPLPVTFTYFGDLGRTLTYLPYILLVRSYAYDQFRMLYSTTELGSYHIRIFCDLRATLDGNDSSLSINPMNGIPPVEPQADLRSTTAQGLFSSRSVFRAMGDQTRVEYSLQLGADLPRPTGLRFMPAVMVNRIAKNITQGRMREIVDGFIERSVDAFPHWLAEIEQSGCKLD